MRRASNSGGLALAVLTLGLAGCLMVGLTGCLKLPERVEVNVGDRRPAPVDSQHTPHPQTLEEAQAELDQAYANLRYLEDENARLSDKADRYKRQRDACEKRLDRYEDK